MGCLNQLDAVAADMVGGGDDLVGLMSNAIEDVNDAKCDRLAGKDD